MAAIWRGGIVRTGIVLSAAMLVGAACGGSSEQSADSTSGMAPPPPVAAAAESAGSAASVTFDLPRPLTMMIRDRRFAEWVNGGAYSDVPPAWMNNWRPVERECIDHPSCSSTNPRRTLVEIDASVDAYGLHLGSIPEYGVVMSRVRVIESGHDSPEKRYRFKRGFTYYFVVERGPTIASGRWHLVEINPGNVAQHLTSGLFTLCGGGGQRPDSSQAYFSECSQNVTPGADSSHVHAAPVLRDIARLRATMQVQGLTDSTRQSFRDSLATLERRLAATLVNPESGPMWVSCIHGCCIAGY